MDGADKHKPVGGQEEGRDAFINPGLTIRRCLRTQSLGGLILAGALMLHSPVAAWSSLFGSLAAYVPSLLFAIVAARRIGSDSAAFLKAAVIGEAAKLLLTALICMAVFLWIKPLAAGWFFAGMITVILIGYMGLIFGH